MLSKSKASRKPAAKAAAKGSPTRLGENLPGSLRKGEPLNVVVARSEVVAGKVRLAVAAHNPTRGTPGGKLLVKHVYRLQEDSMEKEEYRILLRSSLDGKEHAPSLARFGDNYALPDDYSGFVVHEYKLPASGEATLEWEAGAEYTIGSWKSTEVDTHDMKQAKGRLVIRVS